MTTTGHRRPRRTTIATTLAAALLLTACSSGVEELDDGVATLSDDQLAVEETTDVDADGAALAFAACMRDNGVPDYPDPVPGDDGQLELAGGVADLATLSPEEFDELLETGTAAVDACEFHLEGSGVELPGQDTAEVFDTEAYLEFAECMREQGIEEFPDPGPDGFPDPAAVFALDFDDPAFVEAGETCTGTTGFGPAGGGQ